MKTASEKIPEGVKVFDRQKCRIFVDREPMLQSYAFDSERNWDEPIDQWVRTGAKEVLLHAVGVERDLSDMTLDELTKLEWAFADGQEPRSLPTDDPFDLDITFEDERGRFATKRYNFRTFILQRAEECAKEGRHLEAISLAQAALRELADTLTSHIEAGQKKLEASIKQDLAGLKKR